MGEKIYNLAFDFGASSGRMVLCKLEDGKLTLEELHRFPNHEVRVGGHIYWDLFGLYHELKQGLKKAAAKKVPIQSLAIDTWGVDYGLFDKDGNLIALLKNDRNLIYLTSDEIPDTVKEAFVSIEDKRFYKHHGFDPLAIIRAAKSIISSENITQAEVPSPSSWPGIFT